MIYHLLFQQVPYPVKEQLIVLAMLQTYLRSTYVPKSTSKFSILKLF